MKICIHGYLYYYIKELEIVLMSTNVLGRICQFILKVTGYVKMAPMYWKENVGFKSI